MVGSSESRIVVGTLAREIVVVRVAHEGMLLSTIFSSEFLSPDAPTQV